MNDETQKEFLFSWTEELSVGIPEVDNQHRNLVNFVNELHRAIKEKQGRPVSLAIIARLAEYTRTHFLFEESLMRVTNYPDAVKHKKQHDDLVAKVVDLQEKLIKENLPITFELLHFLKWWLEHHIKGDDKDFGLYFQMTNLKKNIPQSRGEYIHPSQNPSQQKKSWWQFWR